jgi:hypothetical protein
MIEIQHDPSALQGAPSQAGSTPDPGPPPDLVAAFGLGDGLRLAELMNRLPFLQTLAFAPGSTPPNDRPPQPLETFAAAGRLALFHREEDFDDAVTRAVVHGEARRLLVVSRPEYREVFPEAAKRFDAAILGARLRRAVVDQTLAEKGDLFRSHLAANLGHVMKRPAFSALKPVVEGRPGFIVGSGPSLEKNGRLLAELQHRGVILAAGSALRPLRAMGAQPHLVVVIEAEDTSDYLAPAPPTGSGGPSPDRPAPLLAVGSAAHPRHFEATGLPTLVFHLSLGAAELFGAADFAPQGGTAGSAAFTLGFLLGLNPLILLGQDQAVGPGGLHAQGTPGDEPFDPREAPFVVPGLDGGRVRTHSGLFASLHWYGEAIRFLGRRFPETRVIHAGEQGAAIPGVPNRTLTQVAAELEALAAPAPDLAPWPDLTPMLEKAPRPDPARVRAVLMQAYEALGALSILARNQPDRAVQAAPAVRAAHPLIRDLWPRPLDSGKDPGRVLRAGLDEAESGLIRLMTELDKLCRP